MSYDWSVHCVAGAQRCEFQDHEVLVAAGNANMSVPFNSVLAFQVLWASFNVDNGLGGAGVTPAVVLRRTGRVRLVIQSSIPVAVLNERRFMFTMFGGVAYDQEAWVTVPLPPVLVRGSGAVELGSDNTPAGTLFGAGTLGVRVWLP